MSHWCDCEYSGQLKTEIQAIRDQLTAKDEEIKLLRETVENSTRATFAWAKAVGRLERQLISDREAHNALVAKATAWGREAVKERDAALREISGLCELAHSRHSAEKLMLKIIEIAHKLVNAEEGKLCDCHLHEHQVCDICQNVVGKTINDNPEPRRSE